MIESDLLNTLLKSFRNPSLNIVNPKESNNPKNEANVLDTSMGPENYFRELKCNSFGHQVMVNCRKKILQEGLDRVR